MLVGEIINGRLVTPPRPAPKHAVASSILGYELQGPFDRGRSGPGGWWILDEPEIHIGSDSLVPDIAGWRRERMSIRPKAAWFDLAPDWLCDSSHPPPPVWIGWKNCRSMLAGVENVWLVDPDLRTLEAFENVDGRWLLITTLKDDDAVGLAPFDAISFSLGGLWAD